MPALPICISGAAVLRTENLNPMARRIAARAVVQDIELHATLERLHGTPWYDIRPMTDEREHSAECIAMAVEAIQYACALRLAIPHPSRPHLVRIDHHALESSQRISEQELRHAA